MAVSKKKTKKKVVKKKATKKKTVKKVTKKKTTKKVSKKKVTKKKVTKKKVTKKKATKKISKKKATKKVSKKKVIKKVAKKSVSYEKTLFNSMVEIIRKTSTELPQDIQDVIMQGMRKEIKNTTAEYAMQIIAQNIERARVKSQPICQDTGTLIFHVSHPVGFNQGKFEKIVKKAVVKATELGYLRQNSVDTLTGENKGMNVGPGHPVIKYHEHGKKSLEVKLMLKGGGSENVSTQYSLPYSPLDAGRDLTGVRKVILDALVKAQGKGCGPGILGVCIGSDRGEGYRYAKEQLFRPVTDKNPEKELAALEKDILESANKLGIGPMGFGGKTTLLGCKICAMNRVPASYFVSISYMCWASRRQGAIIKSDGSLGKWLY